MLNPRADSNEISSTCPLCYSLNLTPFHQDQKRSYLKCNRCQLVSVPRKFHLDTIAEKAHYDLHNNDPSDIRYRNFLSRLFIPLQECLTKPSHGLDFGSGPGPTLSVMLEEAGHQVALLDPYYANDPEVLQHSYDFISSSEVVEHLAQPGKVLEQLWSILLPGGWLGIMTKLWENQVKFATWHYIHDPTHIAFFSKQTWQWWAHRHDAEAVFPAADVVLIKKPTGNS